MSHTARLRAYVADLPPGSMLTSRRVANILGISQAAAYMALMRVWLKGELLRHLPVTSGAIIYSTPVNPERHD